MQNPTAEEGAILKREWWRTYTGDSIPQLQHVIQSYDTAFLKKKLQIIQLSPLGVFGILVRMKGLILFFSTLSKADTSSPSLED